MKTTRVAVLMTCFNRKQKTLNCLDSLFAQSLPEEVQLSAYLVDDGCTDETTSEVCKHFPSVKILSGSGNLFWTGGMRLAFEEAQKSTYDYHLWLNDDVLLHPDAISQLLKTAWSPLVNGSGHKPAIIVGATQDPLNKKLTYGGIVCGKWWYPTHFGWLEVSEQPQPCDTVNGNCVLVPCQVFAQVGNLDATFRHYGADFDYGLRAKKMGYGVWMAPGFVGTCPPNLPKEQAKKNANGSLSEQIQKLEQPKGVPTADVILHPFWEWKTFTERHAGPLWVLYWLLPYRRMLWFI